MSFTYIMSSTYVYFPQFTMQPLSKTTITTIISLLTTGHSYASIKAQTGVSAGAITKIHHDHCPETAVSSGGRPRKLTTANIIYTKRAIRTGKIKNAVQASKALSTLNNNTVSAQTVRRALKSTGLISVAKQRKPLLAPRHRKARLEFAERHLEWTVEDWAKVVWSDETKINRFGSDGREQVWIDKENRQDSRRIKQTVKFGGGNLMMWGCMGWEGVGYATRIEGKMDAELYTNILGDELLKSLEWFGLDVEDVYFQQDNDPKHTSKMAKKWFEDHGFKVLIWPAQSPDLNPIEHLWNHLKRKLNEYENPPKSLHELWERVEKEWEAIPKGVVQDLIASMPRRCAAVVKAKGGHTKY